MSYKNRPIIVSIIALLDMIGGLSIMLLGGLTFLVFFGVFGAEFTNELESVMGSILGTVLGVVAGVVFIVGLIVFLIGRGLWNLNYLAWLISTALYGLSTLSIIIDYENLLASYQIFGISAIISPLITIGLFIYFIKVRSHFS